MFKRKRATNYIMWFYKINQIALKSLWKLRRNAGLVPVSAIMPGGMKMTLNEMYDALIEMGVNADTIDVVTSINGWDRQALDYID